MSIRRVWKLGQFTPWTRKGDLDGQSMAQTLLRGRHDCGCDRIIAAHAGVCRGGGVAYAGGNVTVAKNGDSVTIGNDAISRTFSIADAKVKTAEIHNKRANVKLNPGEGSEEFIIKRTKKDNNAEPEQQPLDQTGWTATADSEAKRGEGEGNGLAGCLIDNSNSTIWHTQYKDENTGQNLADNAIPPMPHEVVIDLGKPTSFKGFSYDPRYTQQNGTGINGNIKDYALWVSTSPDAPSIEGDHATAGWTKVMEGTFNYEGNKGEAIHVNIPEDMQGLCANVECVMLEAKTSVNNNKFAGGEEFDLYAEPWVEPEQQEATPFFLKSSDLTLAGDPVMEDTTAVINKQEKTGKKLSFKFNPCRVQRCHLHHHREHRCV